MIKASYCAFLIRLQFQSAFFLDLLIVAYTSVILPLFISSVFISLSFLYGLFTTAYTAFNFALGGDVGGFGGNELEQSEQSWSIRSYVD